MYIDSHAHIYNEQFTGDRQAAIERALLAGVGKIYMPNVDLDSIDIMLETEEKNPGICIPMMGLHPCDVDGDFEKQLYEVEAWLNRRKFAAVGEMGLDLYWDKTFFEHQKEAFRIQVELAKKHDLPVVLHTRNANREAIDLVRALKDDKLRGIFHCFSGTVAEAREMIDLGFLLGIGGVVTFKNGGLDKVLPEIGLEHLVLETDCPYLPPVPHRGKRNEPSYIPLFAEKVADLLKMDKGQVEEKTTENSLKIFGL
jgi:TatD DNase family protein